MSDATLKSRFPLCWPAGWKRTAAGARTRSNFFSSKLRSATFAGGSQWRERGSHSMEDAVQLVRAELSRLGVREGDLIISTNVKVRLDGLPYSGQAQPGDPGAAIYFRLKRRDVSLACDKWDRVEDNLWAIGKHIEALRGQERWGVGNVEQAFAGYTAIPERTGGVSWWDVLGVAINADADTIKDAYRAKAKVLHPDAGGSTDEMARLNEAYTLALSQNGRLETAA